MLSFGENLKRIRRNKKLSQEQLAERSGLSKTTLHYYENNERFPTIENIPILAKALDVSTLSLMVGEVFSSEKEFISQELVDTLNLSIRYFGWQLNIVYDELNKPICLIPQPVSCTAKAV